MDLVWLAPSPRMWRARQLLIGVVAGVTAIAGGVVAGLTGGVLDAIAVVAILLVAAAIVALVFWRRYRSWGYAERVDDLLVRRGVLVRRLTVVPYGRMQFVDVTAGPIDRIFGLATVQLHTAAAATDARIPGLTGSEAERLRDRLAQLGETKATGL